MILKDTVEVIFCAVRRGIVMAVVFPPSTFGDCIFRADTYHGHGDWAYELFIFRSSDAGNYFLLGSAVVRTGIYAILRRKLVVI